MFIPFQELPETKTDVGSKAYMLAMMQKAGYPVPPGAILEEKPSHEEFLKILVWWKTFNHAPLAVRSSARGEDSEDKSFAGQNTTFLNVKTENELKTAIEKCFDSSKNGPSVIYRQFFSQSDNSAKMNVVLQVMINPKYAGVYFSKDPTKEDTQSWLVEAVEGLGEDLVAGKKTPKKFSSIEEPCEIPLKDIVFWGEKVRQDFNFEVDMEWAYGQSLTDTSAKDPTFYVLQARPITTKNNRAIEKKFISDEIKRLQKIYPADSLFDGATFAEWPGVMSPVSYTIWQKVFSPGGAYDLALQKLGYCAFPKNLELPQNSLLQIIFGRGHLVLSKLADFYFGTIPYTYEKGARPKLKFDWRKLTPSLVFKAPATWIKMFKVAYSISSNRRELLIQLQKDLEELKVQRAYFSKVENLNEKELNELISILKTIVEHFTRYTLRSPMLLVTLIESTTQTIKTLLKGVVPDDEIDKTFESWMHSGFQTITFSMQQKYQDASLNPEKQALFLENFGHRGIGDLDLSHPRYAELGAKAFATNLTNHNHTKINSLIKTNSQTIDPIANLKTYKRELIQKEWNILKEMLFLREEFKMYYLKEYNLIRLVLMAISEKSKLKDDIFYLSIDQILEKNFNKVSIIEHKEMIKILKKVSLPPIFELHELEDFLLCGPVKGKKRFTAEALSPGLIYGEIRVVLDPENTDTSLWPNNVIIVAESTDPGWTGLFIKARGLIVEKGGILSHSAIVAREMGLPAVGQLHQCHLILKDGDKVWLDGNNGTITLR